MLPRKRLAESDESSRATRAASKVMDEAERPKNVSEPVEGNQDQATATKSIKTLAPRMIKVEKEDPPKKKRTKEEAAAPKENKAVPPKKVPEPVEGNQDQATATKSIKTLAPRMIQVEKEDPPKKKRAKEETAAAKENKAVPPKKAPVGFDPFADFGIKSYKPIEMTLNPRMIKVEKEDPPKKKRAKEEPSAAKENKAVPQKNVPAAVKEKQVNATKTIKTLMPKTNKKQEEASAPKDNYAPVESKRRKGKATETVVTESVEDPQDKAADTKRIKTLMPKTSKAEKDDPRQKKQAKEEALDAREDAPVEAKRRRGRTTDTAAKKKEAETTAKKKEVETAATKKEADTAAKKKGTESPVRKKVGGRRISSGAAAAPTAGDKKRLKIISWNVAGLRANIKKKGIDFLLKEDADIVCLQELKCDEGDIPVDHPVVKLYPYRYIVMSTKLGYAGVAIWCREKPRHINYGIDSALHDDEGRVVTVEFAGYHVVCAYVPNAGRKLVRLDKRLAWNAIFADYVTVLNGLKPVIIVGDLNVAHEAIDLANPRSNNRNAGFTAEERDGFSQLLARGFTDTFRHLYPEETGKYTFWSYMSNSRARNVGWRLDYFLISDRSVDAVIESAMLEQVMGSDHCPIRLELDMAKL